MSESTEQTDALISQLRQLQPASAQLDARQAFYRAGYEACRAQTRTRNIRHRAIAIAASVLVVITLVPTSYQLGRRDAMSRGSGGIARSDARDAIHEPLSPASQQPFAVQAANRASDPDKSDVKKFAAKPKPRNPLASWFNPLPSIAKSTKLERQSESMVMTSHASLFALEGSIRDLSAFPFSLPSPDEVAAGFESESINPSKRESRPTLAVGDFQAIANTLETTR